MDDGVETVGGFEVRHVTDAFEDFEVGVWDGLVQKVRVFNGGVGVFGADEDEGGDGDVVQGLGVVLALGASA